MRSETERDLDERRTETLRARAAHRGSPRKSSTGSSEELERRDQGLADRETHVRELQEELKAGKGDWRSASWSASPG